MVVPGDQDVTLEGVLLFGQHDSRLQDRVREPGSLQCSVFVVFPGTPAFLTPGHDWENRKGDAQLSEFSLAYQRESKTKGFQPKRVRVHGTLVKGGGFGYRGVYRTAILAKRIEFTSER